MRPTSAEPAGAARNCAPLHPAPAEAGAARAARADGCTSGTRPPGQSPSRFDPVLSWDWISAAREPDSVRTGSRITMPDNSFDVVSKIEMPEVHNAVQQAQKEIQQRYDLKDSHSTIELKEKDNKILLPARTSSSSRR